MTSAGPLRLALVFIAKVKSTSPVISRASLSVRLADP